MALCGTQQAPDAGIAGGAGNGAAADPFGRGKLPLFNQVFTQPLGGLGGKKARPFAGAAQTGLCCRDEPGALQPITEQKPEDRAQRRGRL